MLALRPAEADAFYNTQFGAAAMTEDERRVQRQAFAGMLWSKQFYYYEVARWQPVRTATTCSAYLRSK